jgi:uncharacterized protein DUF6545
MTNAAAYAACALAVLVAAYKLIRARSSPSLWFMCAFGLCLGTAMALLAPATVAALEPVATLAGDELKLVALLFLVLLAWSVQPTGSPLRHVAVAVAVVGAQAVLFFAAGPRAGADGVRADHTAVMVAYDLAFLGYGAFALVIFMRLIGRQARRVPPGLLRGGLWLILGASVLGLGWLAWKIEGIRNALATGWEDSGEDTTSAVFGAACVLLSAAGATVSAWGAPLWAWWSYHRLTPLWSALHAAVPAIRLSSKRIPIRGPRFALYRRIIEIHDGHLALRLHFDPDLAGRIGGPAATVEAVTIAAALAARKAGRRYTEDGYVPRDVHPDVETEAAWLIEVNDAFVSAM